MLRATLTCHGNARDFAVAKLDAHVVWSGDGTLRFSYRASGEMDRVRVPHAARPKRTDGLWRHTCFEAFLRAGGSAYYELNWSPSGEWAAYRFEDYRRGGIPAPSDAPAIASRVDAHTLTLDADLAIADLPELVGIARLELALAAVLEEHDGRRSYWALAHPASAPDFHHPKSFTAAITQPLIARAGDSA